MANPSNHGAAIVRLACDPKFFENANGSTTVRVIGYAENDFANKNGDITAEKLQFERYLPQGRKGAFAHMHAGDLVGFGYHLRNGDYTNKKGEKVYGGIVAVINSVKLYSSKPREDEEQGAKQTQAAQTQQTQDQQEQSQDTQPQQQAQTQQETQQETQQQTAPTQQAQSQDAPEQNAQQDAQQALNVVQEITNHAQRLQQQQNAQAQAPQQQPTQAPAPVQVQPQAAQPTQQPVQQTYNGPAGFENIFGTPRPAQQTQQPVQQQPAQAQQPVQPQQPAQRDPDLPYGMGGVMQNPAMAQNPQFNSTYSAHMQAQQAAQAQQQQDTATQDNTANNTPENGYNQDNDTVPF